MSAESQFDWLKNSLEYSIFLELQLLLTGILDVVDKPADIISKMNELSNNFRNTAEELKNTNETLKKTTE